MTTTLRCCALALLVLLLAGPARASGFFVGFYRVEGELPGGERFTGSAALTGTPIEHHYAVLLEARAASGQRLAGSGRLFREPGRRFYSTLELERPGLTGAVSGGGAELAFEVEHRLLDDGYSFEGTLRPRRGAGSGTITFTRARGVSCAFSVGRVVIEETSTDGGGTGQVELRGPSDLLDVVFIESPPGSILERRPSGSGDARAVKIEAAFDAGDHLIRARLGSRRGPVLATCCLSVGPATTPLAQVTAEVSRAKAAGEAPVVLFDLDDTLVTTATRHAAIIRDFGAVEREPDLARAGVEHVRATLADTLRALDVPRELLEGPVGAKLRSHWLRAYHDGSRLHLDPARKGAPDYVGCLAAAGAKVVYLTERRPETRQATVDSLRALGFPAGELRFTPAALASPIRAWKALALRAQPVTGRVVAAFDDQPATAEALRRELPGARVEVVLPRTFERR
jgi:hypothetical protein